MLGRVGPRQPPHGVKWARQIGSAPIQNSFPVRKTEVIMLKWAAIFFVIAIVAAVLGFGGIAAGAAEIAKILFFVFLVIFLVALILGVMRK
jgi:uncharacterized membrane protein YtjA (UPF0391 family)